MRILMTGGAGYVGSACLRWLLKRGHDPVAYDNLTEGNVAAVPDPDRRLIEGDILDPDGLIAAMTGGGFDAVMHFAALAIVPESVTDPDRYWTTNVVGTLNVLNAMRAAGVPRIVFSSTAATYAFTDKMPLTEADLQDPQTPYGTSKLAAERLIADFSRAYDLGYAILRYFNASGADIDGGYGEDRRHETHLIPLVFAAALGHREAITVFGDDWPTPDGTCVRDYIHTQDLASAHERCLEAIEPGLGRAYNLGSGVGCSVLDVIKAAEAVSGRSIPVRIGPRRPGDPAVLVASSEKIQRELGWSMTSSDLETIVESSWKWHVEHPSGFAAAPAPGTMS